MAPGGRSLNAGESAQSAQELRPTTDTIQQSAARRALPGAGPDPMTKRIGIDQLKPGMRIEWMDRPWMMTPFLRHRMWITSAEQVAQLRACGVRRLDVTVDPRAAVASSAVSAPEPEPAPSSVADAPAEPEPVQTVPYEEELPAARQVYQAAKTVIEAAMHDARMGRAINMDAVHAVVTDMTDSVLRHPDALTSLSRLKRFDEYTFFHSVNTALLAISLGRALGLHAAALHQLGVGTLLHDIGKTKIPLDILNKPGRFEAREYEVMKQHVMRGAEVLSGMTGLDEACVRPTLEHHERVDGSGYPHHRAKPELSQFGLIAAVVDIYDAITSDRCYHKAKPAHEALQFLYLISQKGHVDHALVQRFIRVVGVYPVGSIVQMNTGELAVVRRLHHEAPLEPIVILVKGPGHTLLSRPEEVDLHQQTGRPYRNIATVKDPVATGLNPSAYLDPENL